MSFWFLAEKELIRGPFSTEDLQKVLQNNTQLNHLFVWTRGQTEWISANRWNPQDFLIPEEKTNPQYTETLNFQSPAQTEPQVSELLNDIKDKSTEKYKVQINFLDQPLMTKEELITLISSTEDLSQISIYDIKNKEWKDIYAFRELVDQLGLTRRKHPRVPILAQFTGTKGESTFFSARVVTISIGGLGLTDVFDLQVGDKISGQVSSPHFYSTMTIEAEVTYSGKDGYVGLKFTQVSDEAQSLITDYVNRFASKS